MKRLFLVCVTTALLFGCSSEDFQQAPQRDNSTFLDIKKVEAKINGFLPEEGTRTTITQQEDNNWLYAWADGDVIGMFAIEPEAGGQVAQKVSLEEPSGSSAIFDGGAWLLKKGYKYAAYYPFCSEMKLGDSYDDIPVDMTGQVQNGLSNSAHLGAYDYMYAAPEANENGYVYLTFDHIGSILATNITMPSDATLKKLIFSAESDMFVTKAKMNAVDGSIVATETNDTVMLDLTNAYMVGNQASKFYLSLLPTVNDQKEVITVTAIDVYNKIYTGTMRAIKVNKGYTYDRDVTLESYSDDYDDKDYVDLGTGDGVLWGRYNVNIAGSSSFEYYAWAEKTTKSSYTLYNYNSYDEDEEALTYCTPAYGGRSTMSQKAGDDVAYSNMTPKKNWRIPTSEEMQNLIDRCVWEWTKMNGVNGYKVTNASVPARWIFIPAAGYMDGSSLSESTSGYYWTTDLNTMSNDWEEGYCLKINSAEHTIASKERWFGLTIRPVYIGQ